MIDLVTIMPENKKLLYISNLAIVACAMASTIPAASLVPIGESFSLNLAEKGRIFLFGSLGFFTSIILGGYLSDLIGKKMFIMFGIYTLSFGLALASISRHYYILLLASGLIGIGAGLIEGLISALISDLYAKKRTKTLNITQSFFNIGAIIGPVMAGAIIQKNLGWRTAYLATSVMTLAIAIIYSRVPVPPNCHTDKINGTVIPSLLKDRLFIFLNLVMFLYVGAEIGIAAWIPNYLSEEYRLKDSTSGIVLGAFWGLMMLGRLIYSWAIEKLHALRLIFISTIGAFIWILINLVTNSVTISILSFCGIGLFFAGIWPTILAYAGEKFPRYSGTIFGIIIASGSVAAVIFPWLIGIISNHIGLKNGMGVVAILMALNLIVLWRLK